MRDRLRRFYVLSFCLTLACATACDGGPDERVAGDDPTLDTLTASAVAPSFPVGTRRIEVNVAPGRTLPVQLWYPAVESAREEAARGRPLADIEPAGANRDTLSALLETAPEPCTSHTLHAADTPAPATQAQPFPLLMFSHCMSCIRWSSFTLAEHLASLGFVVAAPDHLGDTLYDKVAKKEVGLTDLTFIERRTSDIREVLDVLLSRSSVVPEGLRGRLDSSRVGMYGHSYGSWTTQVVLERDRRVRAGAMLALPSFSITGTAGIEKPGLYFKAAEDNMITELGNLLLTLSYQQYGGAASLLTVADAGHYSFTDLVNIDGTPYFKAGCGRAQRQTNPFASFTYLDVGRARDLTKRYLGAFFQKELLGIGNGVADVDKPAEVTIQSKPARR